MCIMIFEMMGREHMTRAMFGAAILAVALLAAGCAQKPAENDDVAMTTTTEQLRRAPTQPAVRPSDPAAEEEEPQQETAAASKQPEPVAPAPAETEPVYSAAELVGKSQSEVAALIGNPAQVEQRAASTVWTYRGDSCGLDVFFFIDMATSDERVLTVEPRTEMTAPAVGAATAETTAPAVDATVPAATTAATGAAQAAPAAGEDAGAAGSVVDACYGKLRRS